MTFSLLSFSYGLCDVSLMLYFLVESRNMREVLYLKEITLCVLSYDIWLLSHDMAK